MLSVQCQKLCVFVRYRHGVAPVAGLPAHSKAAIFRTLIFNNQCYETFDGIADQNVNLCQFGTTLPDGLGVLRAGAGAYSNALTISSHIFLASPNSIIVLSRKNNSFSTPA